LLDSQINSLLHYPLHENVVHYVSGILPVSINLFCVIGIFEFIIMSNFRLQLLLSLFRCMMGVT